MLNSKFTKNVKDFGFKFVSLNMLTENTNKTKN